MRERTGLLAAGSLLAMSLAVPAMAETVIRFAHMNSPTHFVNTAGEELAAAIAERTGQEVTVEMFPSGQLGENAQITEQITLGGNLIGQVGVGTIAD